MSDAKTIGTLYLSTCLRKVDAWWERINHCVRQLNEEQIWYRPHSSMNSVANILLHLCGNLTQWIVAGIRQEPDTRNRPQEFAERSPLAKDELLGRLEETLKKVKAVLSQLEPEQLLESRRIQGFDETILSAVFDSLSHMGGHVQEIIYITRLQLGEQYQFAWVPQTKEEGAPG